MVTDIFQFSQIMRSVPEGKWYNILTEQMVEGEKWHKETHDYFSMPLLVRGNTILALGSNEYTPEYDYTENTTIYLSCFEDGAESMVTIPNLKGQPEVTVHAKRKDEEIYVWTEGKKVDFKYQVIGDENLAVVIK